MGLLVITKAIGDADGDEEIGRDVGDGDVSDVVVGQSVGLSDVNKFIDGCCGEDVMGLLVVGDFDGAEDVSCGEDVMGLLVVGDFDGVEDVSCGEDVMGLLVVGDFDGAEDVACGEDVTGPLVVTIAGDFDGENDDVVVGGSFPGQGKNSQFCSGFLVTIGPLMQKYRSCSHVWNWSLTSGSFGQGKKSQS